MAEAMEHYKLGIDAFKAGDIDTAIEELEAATQLDQENHKAFSFLGAAYAAKERYDAAIGAFKLAEQIAPGIAKTHYNIAQAYEASGISSEAVYEYGRALEIDPSYEKARLALESLENRLRQL